jgi:hypothetical protein
LSIARILLVPLTPAHAAAVVPLGRWKPYLWLSPLVVGSMAPDYAYYLFLPHEWWHVGHTAWGLVLFCIPAGLAVLYAFHRFLKRPLVLLMPQPLRAKLWPHCGPFPLLPLRRLAWICVLVFLGAVTHVVWDGFTHEDDLLLRDCPQLKAAVISAAGGNVHCFGWLQYGSSLLGLGLLAWWSWQWYRGAPAGRAPADSAFLWRSRSAIATIMIVFGAAVGIVCGLAYAFSLEGPFSVRGFITVAFITGVDAFAVALLVFIAAMNVLVPGAGESEQYGLLRDLRGGQEFRKLRSADIERS